MELSKEAIREFKEVWYEEFREKLSDAKARELGENFLLLFKIIYRPIPKDKKQDNNGKFSKPV